jgi:hypothetical protein
MNWLNIGVADLNSDNFISASLEQRGAWLGLLRYCITQENGGEIIRCQHWTDLQWMQACGVTTAIVKDKSTLWNWNGDCLRVVAYPWDMEKAVQRKRAIGKKFAEKRWEKEVEAKAKRPRKYGKITSITGAQRNSAIS